MNATPQGPPRKRVVLVVEDDRPIGELLASIINDEEGYVAIHVMRPTEALAALEKVRPDLLVLDVGLPGMSGIELYDRIRQNDRFKNVPVMFETAVGYEYRKEFQRRGILDLRLVGGFFQLVRHQSAFEKIRAMNVLLKILVQVGK